MKHFNEQTHGNKMDALESAREELAESGGVLLDLGGTYAVGEFADAVDLREGQWASRVDEAAYWCKLALAGYDETLIGKTLKTYSIAFAGGNGGWDVVSEFTAVDDAEAESWAEAHEPILDAKYNNTEWYILDANGNNING